MVSPVRGCEPVLQRWTLKGHASPAPQPRSPPAPLWVSKPRSLFTTEPSPRVGASARRGDGGRGGEGRGGPRAPPSRQPAPAPARGQARREAGGGDAEEGRAARARGRGDPRWARLRRLEARRRECVTPAEGSVGCGRPADQQPGVPDEGEAAAPSLAASARPGSPASRLRLHSFRGSASSPGSAGASEVSVPPVPGGAAG